MISLRKIAAPVTCVAVISVATILWPVYKKKAMERKLAEATRLIRVHAEQGDAKAQLSLGNMYRNGQAVPQDYAEAVRWYRKAAGQGDTKAQIVLGNMYRKGQGVPRSYAEAVRWYGKGTASSLARCLSRDG